MKSMPTLVPGLAVGALALALTGFVHPTLAQTTDPAMNALIKKGILTEAEAKAALAEAAKAPAATPAPAAKATGKEVGFFWKDGLNFQSADGKTFKGKIGGRMQYDFAGYDESDAVESLVGHTPFSSEFRRARLYTSGELNEGVPVYYILQMEFAGSDTRFADAYIGIKDIPYVGSVQVGQMYEPLSLEQLTSDNYVTFLERALPIEAFSPARNVGGQVQRAILDERMTYAFGGFANDETDDADGVAFEQNARFTGRITGLPWYDAEAKGRRYLHLGAGGSIVNPQNDTVRYRSRPESHLAPRYVDTGAFAADRAYLANLEALLTYDRLSIQAEYFRNWTDANGSSDPSFQGAYAFVSYFLTDDYRPYRKSSGVVDRVKPTKNFSFSGGGLGAWELLARISYLDLNDGAVSGGRLTDYTAGLGWYLNANTRMLFNYIYADLDRGTVSDGAHIFQTRLQIDF
jgi:phosphate-selective porin OprO/OprP